MNISSLLIIGIVADSEVVVLAVVLVKVVVVLVGALVIVVVVVVVETEVVVFALVLKSDFSTSCKTRSGRGLLPLKLSMNIGLGVCVGLFSKDTSLGVGEGILSMNIGLVGRVGLLGLTLQSAQSALEAGVKAGLDLPLCLMANCKKFRLVVNMVVLGLVDTVVGVVVLLVTVVVVVRRGWGLVAVFMFVVVIAVVGEKVFVVFTFVVACTFVDGGAVNVVWICCILLIVSESCKSNSLIATE